MRPFAPFRAVSVFAVASSAFAAPAVELVRDGDFELAAPGAASPSVSIYTAGQSFDGGLWRVSSSGSGLVGIDTGNEFVIGGQKSVFLFSGGIVQTLTTVPGQRYAIAFDAYASADAAPTFVSFGGTSLTVAVPTTLTRFTLSALATSTSTPLSFSVPDFQLELDNVSVQAVQSVPEPTASAALALGVLPLLRRRRA